MSLGGILITPSAASELPQPVLDAIGLSLGNSLTYLFMIGAVISIFALCASIFIRGSSLKVSDAFATATPEAGSTMSSVLA